MELPALAQADVGLAWGTLPWHISWAGRPCVEHPPLPAFSVPWDCAVFVQVAARAAQRTGLPWLCSHVQLQRPPQICVNRSSSPHVLRSLMQCCSTRPWEYVVCICGGEVPLAGDKRQGFSLKHLSGTR